jgi:DNA repair protein RadA/Sms
MEGTRPFLIEVQALVVYSRLPMPRRVASGFDGRRLELLLAVLQKQCKLSLDSSDVYINIAGGLKVNDPAVDLAVCLAIFSSFKNVALSNVVAISEVGLLGELRNVSGLEKRAKEATKLGITSVISALSYKSLPDAIQTLGGVIKEDKEWQKKDERHFTVERE